MESLSRVLNSSSVPWLPCPRIPPFCLMNCVNYTSVFWTAPTCSPQSGTPIPSIFRVVCARLRRGIRAHFVPFVWDIRPGHAAEEGRRLWAAAEPEAAGEDFEASAVEAGKAGGDGRQGRDAGEAGVLGQRVRLLGGGHRHGGRTHTHHHHRPLQPGYHTQGQKGCEIANIATVSRKSLSYQLTTGING